MSLRRYFHKPTPPSTPAPEGRSTVPAVLPQILLEEVAEDRLIVTVNGDKLAATPITRAQITSTLTELVARFGSPTRVEVRELDGSIHADILTPPPPRSAFAPPETEAQVPVAVPSLAEFTGQGFVPGEDVALALIIRHTSAAPDGNARALLDLDERPRMTGEVILFGRISGTLVVHRIG